MPDKPLNVLLVGSGAREHALAWKLAQSPLLDRLAAAPGNPGIARFAECFHEIGVDRPEAIADLAARENIDLVVAGPEAPLVAGLAEICQARGIPCFGPTSKAAQLESSKAFAKDFCRRHNIPTADYQCFAAAEDARAYISSLGEGSLVVKADGLAAGKGVCVAENREQAAEFVDDVMTRKVFGTAGEQIVIEECLEGYEVSVFAFMDETGYRLLPTVQDHKRIGEGDTGPNTGGMGAYSPASGVDDYLNAQIEEQIIKRLHAGLTQDRLQYRGVIFAGLMITPQGPKLIEFNVRFGDPECEALMPRLEGDILPALLHTARGELKDAPVFKFSNRASFCVVLASEGYPGSYPMGEVIQGLEQAQALADIQVFYAGTRMDGEHIVTAGGRVLAVTATANSLPKARDKAYEAAARIDWPHVYFRRDIGWRALASEVA